MANNNQNNQSSTVNGTPATPANTPANTPVKPVTLTREGNKSAWVTNARSVNQALITDYVRFAENFTDSQIIQHLNNPRTVAKCNEFWTAGQALAVTANPLTPYMSVPRPEAQIPAMRGGNASNGQGSLFSVSAIIEQINRLTGRAKTGEARVSPLFQSDTKAVSVDKTSGEHSFELVLKNGQKARVTVTLV